MPGGFVDYGESLEEAARREALEETGLAIRLHSQLHSYSDPQRDARGHTISTVFVASGSGILQAGDDAGTAAVFTAGNLPPLVFDHEQILRDYFRLRPELRRYYP